MIGSRGLASSLIAIEAGKEGLAALNMSSTLRPASLPEQDLAERFQTVRERTLDLVAPLSDADASAQSMVDASPAKWHLAHTTWFFEIFILRDHLEGYRLFNERWPFLFNSYYEAEGARQARSQRGLLTRPALGEVRRFREYVDQAVLTAIPFLAERCGELLELGLHHEEQHQELLLTDVKHLFSCNPLGPALWPMLPVSMVGDVADSGSAWREFSGGLVEVGTDGDAFAFDCEQPRHKHFLNPYALARRTVTNGEWVAFMEDGGYRNPALWLDEGWNWVKAEGIESPLYWRCEDDGHWMHFTLAGWQPVDSAAPVVHISLFEADAFAAWSSARLPTEQEWEHAAQGLDPDGGMQFDGEYEVGPRAASDPKGLSEMFGSVWEWTGSPYRPYPGFRAAKGAVGEYNGKFMSNQFVLKGGSFVTPRGHMRGSYRNFFQPEKRWQFTGLRLAKDLT